MSFYGPGREIAGRYVLQELLGVGPVATSYLAFDRVEDDELVVVKLFSPGLFPSEADRSHFLEALPPPDVLSHPGFLALHEAGLEEPPPTPTTTEHAQRWPGEGAENAPEPQPFWVSSYAPGDSLRYVLRRRGRLHLAEAEGILWQLCEALHAVKEYPHGGIRPENVLVLAGAVRLTDFGLFAALPKGSYVAAVAQRPGACYLAPELRGEGEPSCASDVFALGALLYEMLSGKSYRGAGLPVLAKATKSPAALDEILVRSLAPRPQARYATPEEFLSHLKRLRQGVKKKTAPAQPQPSPPPPEPASLPPAAATPEASLPEMPTAPAFPPPPPDEPALPPELPLSKPPFPQEPPVHPPALQAQPASEADDAFLDAEVIEVEDADIEEESAIPEVSRIETIIPAPPEADQERTRIWLSLEKPKEHEDDAITGVRSPPTPPLSQLPLEDPGDDLFIETPTRASQKEAPEHEDGT